MSEKIRIEITNKEYDMLVELQKELGHKTLDDTINIILKEYLEKEQDEFDETNPPTGGSGVPNLEEELSFKEICAIKDKIEEEHDKAKAAINKRHKEYTKAISGRKRVYNAIRKRIKDE